jgi:hypothetical protein
MLAENPFTGKGFTTLFVGMGPILRFHHLAREHIRFSREQAAA